jgi:hypothetical protein
MNDPLIRRTHELPYGTPTPAGGASVDQAHALALDRLRGARAFTVVFVGDAGSGAITGLMHPSTFEDAALLVLLAEEAVRAMRDDGLGT